MISNLHVPLTPSHLRLRSKLSPARTTCPLSSLPLAGPPSKPPSESANRPASNICQQRNTRTRSAFEPSILHTRHHDTHSTRYEEGLHPPHHVKAAPSSPDTSPQFVPATTKLKSNIWCGALRVCRTCRPTPYVVTIEHCPQCSRFPFTLAFGSQLCEI